MLKRKNILFIIPSLRRAGAETQVLDLVTDLSDEHFNKYLFTFEKRLDQLDRVDQSVIHFYNQPRKYKFDFSMARTIASIIDKENIEIVHCTLQIALLMGWIGCKLAKKSPQLVVALHTTLNRCRKDDLLDYFVYQWLMRSCNKIIFVCKAQAEHWIKKYSFIRKVSSIIYNGVDAVYFQPGFFTSEAVSLRQDMGIRPEQFVCCCIAGFRSEKGHVQLVSAFQCLVTKTPSTRLLLAGDGPEMDNIKALVKHLNLENNVLFLGVVKDVRALLESTNVLVIPSTAETFSMVMLESMSMGVPLVATDVGGTREAVLHDQTGIIVESDNVTALADALINMFEHVGSISVMGKCSRDRVIKHFTKSRMISETTKVLFDTIY